MFDDFITTFNKVYDDVEKKNKETSDKMKSDTQDAIQNVTTDWLLNSTENEDLKYLGQAMLEDNDKTIASSIYDVGKTSSSFAANKVTDLFTKKLEEKIDNSFSNNYTKRLANKSAEKTVKCLEILSGPSKIVNSIGSVIKNCGTALLPVNAPLGASCIAIGNILNLGDNVVQSAKENKNFIKCFIKSNHIEDLEKKTNELAVVLAVRYDLPFATARTMLDRMFDDKYTTASLQDVSEKLFANEQTIFNDIKAYAKETLDRDSDDISEDVTNEISKILKKALEEIGIYDIKDIIPDIVFNNLYDETFILDAQSINELTSILVIETAEAKNTLKNLPLAPTDSEIEHLQSLKRDVEKFRNLIAVFDNIQSEINKTDFKFSRIADLEQERFSKLLSSLDEAEKNIKYCEDVMPYATSAYRMLIETAIDNSVPYFIDIYNVLGNQEYCNFYTPFHIDALLTEREEAVLDNLSSFERTAFINDKKKEQLLSLKNTCFIKTKMLEQEILAVKENNIEQMTKEYDINYDEAKNNIEQAFNNDPTLFINEAKANLIKEGVLPSASLEVKPILLSSEYNSDYVNKFNGLSDSQINREDDDDNVR